MKLRFRRRQSSGPTGRVRFKLWGKIEPEGDETAVIRKYKLDNAILIFSDQEGLLLQSIIVFAISSLLAWGIFFQYLGVITTLWVAPAIGIACGWWNYDKSRETVYVKDLLHGRYFSCGSVVDLAQKEAWLQQVVSFLRQVMETSKYWDGEEPVEIPVLDKETAKQIVIKGL